jgi:hypothetical protein
MQAADMSLTVTTMLNCPVRSIGLIPSGLTETFQAWRAGRDMLRMLLRAWNLRRRAHSLGGILCTMRRSACGV